MRAGTELSTAVPYSGGHCHPGKGASRPAVLPPAHLLAVGVVKHVVHDVLSQLGLIGVGRPAHPGVDDALVVCALKGHLGECRESELPRQGAGQVAEHP